MPDPLQDGSNSLAIHVRTSIAAHPVQVHNLHMCHLTKSFVRRICGQEVRVDRLDVRAMRLCDHRTQGSESFLVAFECEQLGEWTENCGTGEC